MPNNTPADAPPSVATLMGGVIEDLQQLIRQEATLARRELQDEWTKAKEGGILMGGAIALFALVGVLFGFTLVELVHQYLLPNQLWACFAIVTALFGGAGAILFFAAQARLERVHLVPPQSAASIRQDVEAVAAAVTATPTNSNLVGQR